MPNPNRPEQGSRPDRTRADLDEHEDDLRTKPTSPRDMPEEDTRSEDKALAWTYTCAAEHDGCAFQVRSDDPDEVVELSRRHLERVHHENLHPEEVRRNKTQRQTVDLHN